MASLRSAKKELRSLFRQRLARISLDSIQRQSLAVSNLILAMPEYQTAAKISIYLSMPQGELSTRLIVLDALSKGKEVYVPCIYKSASLVKGVSDSVMDMVSLHSQADYDSLETDPWGIPVPAEASLAMRKKCLGFFRPESNAEDGSSNALQNLDMILMPGMAFDRNFARLGHGKGYYDYFLARYHDRVSVDGHMGKMPFLVGLALGEQILPEHEDVPTNTSDWRVDALVAGSGVILRRQL